MPLAHDVAVYRLDGEPIEVPFHKRAQITVSHLDHSVTGAWAFDDVGELTAFDNLVPHVLRMAGVLAYDDRLAHRIDGGELLVPGSPEEVEIRACGLHAVELLAARTGLIARRASTTSSGSAARTPRSRRCPATAAGARGTERRVASPGWAQRRAG